MLLTNEFVVAADVDTVWSHLLDMEEVAECVPGAKVEEIVPPSTYRGKIRLKIGPMTVEYRGEATLLEVDDDAHQATIQMKAREARGQGSALATVRNSLAAVPGGTRVRAETQLEITGPQAQFGKGVLEDVGGRILEEFTVRLERRIAAAQQGSGAEASSVNGAGSPSADTAARSGPRPSETPEDDTLDLNRVLASSLRERGLKIGAVVAAVLAAIGAIWRWRRCSRSKS